MSGKWRVLRIFRTHTQEQSSNPVARILNSFGNKHEAPPLDVVRPPWSWIEIHPGPRMSQYPYVWHVDAAMPEVKIMRTPHHLYLYP